MNILIPLLLAVGTTSVQPCAALHEYDALTSVVTREFYDRTFRGLNWNARLSTYRARVHCDSSPSDVASAVNGALAALHASHTGVYTAQDLEYWALESIFARNMDTFETNVSGIWPEKQGGKWYARYVFPGSPAAAAGVAAGDELISLNGRNFDPLGFSVRSASTLTVSPDGHSRRAILITPVHESIQKALLDATERSTRILHVGRQKVGYFHLWSGTDPLFLHAMNSALARFETQHIDALVLDLRGGYGGADLQYLARLRTSRHLQQIPKYALIDGGVRSGKEWVAAVIRQDRIATLVGSRTAGAFLGGLANHLFNDKYFLYVAGREFIPPGIGPLEGVGVAPNVTVAPCLRFCRGSDPQLSAVLRIIRTLPAGRRTRAAIPLRAALAWQPPSLRLRSRRAPGRPCDLGARSCWHFFPPPRLCLLSFPGAPRCPMVGRFYWIAGSHPGVKQATGASSLVLSTEQRPR